MRVSIKAIEYHLPDRVLTNEDLHDEHPSWDMAHVEAHTGVRKRHIARDDETALDLALRACNKLFSVHEDARSRIDGILFCTQSPDYIMPPNSCILHKMLGLGQDVFALDFNLACSGYIYGLAMAQGLIQTGIASNVLLVTADTYSRYIHEKDRSARVLFGDGAAVSWITSSDTSGGIVDIQCSTSGEHYGKFIIPAGGCRLPKSNDTALPETTDSGSVRTPENIHMDGIGILTFVNSRIPGQVREVLNRNGLAVNDIKLCVFHQASKVALDALSRLLDIPQAKMYRNLMEVGNTVSASIPIALKDAFDSQSIVRGDRVLLCGFGVGLSWGTAILEI